MKKVAVYVRVSTDKQDVENQLVQLREYAKKMDWTVYKEYTDITSGVDTKRKAFKQLFQDARQRLFDIVLFWSLDRFSRSGTLFVLKKLKDLDNYGVMYHSYKDDYISSIDSEFKDIIISVMATIAKLERERISQRTKAGLQVAKAKGKLLGRKPIPKHAEKHVIALLTQENPPSYRKISELVTYKSKYGKVHHISIAHISKINNLRSKKGDK